jgi:hypothetical protein
LIGVHAERSGSLFVVEPIELDDEFVRLRAWGTPRNPDSYELVLSYGEITRIEADSEYLRNFSRLFTGSPASRGQ